MIWKPSNKKAATRKRVVRIRERKEQQQQFLAISRILSAGTQQRMRTIDNKHTSDCVPNTSSTEHFCHSPVLFATFYGKTRKFNAYYTLTLSLKKIEWFIDLFSHRHQSLAIPKFPTMTRAIGIVIMIMKTIYLIMKRLLILLNLHGNHLLLLAVAIRFDVSETIN